MNKGTTEYEKNIRSFLRFHNRTFFWGGRGDGNPFRTWNTSRLSAIVGSSDRSTPVVSKLFRAVTQIKVAIMSYYPQYFAS